MSSPTNNTQAKEGATRRRPRFPWFGRHQLWVTLSLVVVIIGTMLPWFDTFIGTRYGLDGWGILAAWGAAVGLVGAFSVKIHWFRVLPLVGSAIAVGIVVWTVIEGIEVCTVAPDGSAPCRPAIGLIITGAAALNGLWWSVRAFREVVLPPRRGGSGSPGGADEGGTSATR